MIARIEPTERQLVSPLGRTSPLLKLGVALAWLVGLALTLDPRPPIALTLIALVGGLVLGRVPVGRLARGVAPLWLAALGIGVFNAAFSGSNADPSLPVAVALGPLHVTWPAVEAGAALAARVFAIAAVGVVFAQTTDSTRLVDSLAGQLHVPERFAYGALAAYQAIPRLAAQLTTLRQARRMRGLRGWHPRILVAILVLAIRHGDRLALAMDARAFGAGPRTRYRELRWTALDGAVGLGSLAILVAALVVGTLP